MKAQLYSQSGEKKSEIELPEIFSSKIREDLAAKSSEVEKFELRQPYSSYSEAGKRHSASGTISHLRHTWKGHYGKGISRVPRKTMWRRGTQFYWVGAEISGSRGGRISHPPQGIYSQRKINKKETKLAFASAFAATASRRFVLKRYSTLNENALPVIPLVIESVPAKTKDFLSVLEKIFGKAYSLVIRNKEVRPGKGKKRGRKYKSNAGLLLVTAADEKVKCKNIEVKAVKEINIADLYPLGRLTLYTKKALEELKDIK
ncbi:MAG: 50S ribosomal protein L4 [Nanoarchaeota archaeon]